MSPEQLAAILGPNADAAFMKMMMQEDGGPSNSGLVAPTNVGAGLHNIGVYINGAAQFNARKAERKEMMGMFGQAADINRTKANDYFSQQMGGGAAPPMAQAAAPQPSTPSPQPSAPAFARSPVTPTAGAPPAPAPAPPTVPPPMAAPPSPAPAPVVPSAPAFVRPPGDVPPPIRSEQQPPTPGPRSNRMSAEDHARMVAQGRGSDQYKLLQPNQREALEAKWAAAAPAKPEYKMSGEDMLEITDGNVRVLHRGEKSTNEMRNYKAYYDQEVAAGRAPKSFADFSAKANPKSGDTPESRAELAKQFGLTPDSQAYKSYVLTGKLPRDDQKELTAADRNAVRKAEDEILKAQNAMKRIQRAQELNSQTNSGMLASTRAMVGNMLPDALVPDSISSKKSSEATREYEDIMSQEAVKQMGDDLTGASTDFEMKKYMAIVGDVSKPASIRENALRRMIEAGQANIALQQDRARDIRGGDYYGKTYEPPALKAPAAAGVEYIFNPSTGKVEPKK